MKVTTTLVALLRQDPVELRRSSSLRVVVQDDFTFYECVVLAQHWSIH